MKFLNYILLPLQIIYSIVISSRNKLYNFKILKTNQVNSIVISVGNMSTGGTGKTPLVEYIAKLLSQYRLAILSRGYKRKTSGFILANENQKEASQIGDENAQLYHKLENVMIGCDNDRYHGAKKLLELNKQLNIIVLDDAYQHRKIHRDIDIVLTEYKNLFINDSLFPIGSLREHKQGIQRADIIIITKCPKNISNKEREETEIKLKLNPNQKLYFSFIRNYNFLLMPDRKPYIIKSNKSDRKHITITGIQNPSRLIEFLQISSLNFHHLKFKDHYVFQTSDIKHIITLKSSINAAEEILITEKDYYRLSRSQKEELSKHCKLICIAIDIDFISNDKSNFNNQLLNFAKSKINLT